MFSNAQIQYLYRKKRWAFMLYDFIKTPFDITFKTSLRKKLKQEKTMDFGLRRSTRARKNNAVLDSPDPTKRRTLLDCKAVKQEQQQQEEEDHHVFTHPQGHVTEAEVAGIGGVEVIPLDLCSSSEETKPKFDHLSWLQPVSKPNYHVKVPPESREKFMDVAIVLESALLSHLEESAHMLDIAQMVQSANECFTRLRTLEVDYQAFHGEVSRLIKCYQKLKEATDEKNLGLEAAYEKSVNEDHEAKDELHKVENDLFTVQTNHNLKGRKITELREMLDTLEAEAAMERTRLETLTAERNLCHNAHMLSQKKVARLYSELDGIIKRYDATRDEIRRSLVRLRDLVRRL